MLFNSLEFLAFFVVVAFGIMRLPGALPRKCGLLVASFYFYSLWSWKFAGLLAITCVIHWAAARVNKRWSMWCAVGGSVLILAAFKYLGLWIDSIVMPVGISFYTFQAISYTVDCCKGKIENKRPLIDVALYISFFPQLLSGPIVRAADFFSQLDKKTVEPFCASDVKMRLESAFVQFAFGLFKKVFIADRMVVYVGRVFENCNLFDGCTLWLAAIAYTVQIYCDFSGYSDMAIGVARGIGFDYKKNFDHPYLSMSVTEFWRRWHISLSTWLRDYIYIPLGGNRKGAVRQYVNQMVTMLIGGAWHGADMSFIAWGGLHGAALCAHKWWAKSHKMWKPVAWLATMLTVLVGWILFRADTFLQAWTFVSRMFGFASGIAWYHPHVYFAVLITAVGHVFHDKFKSRYWLMTMSLTLMLLSLLYPAGNASPFIYFQF